MSDDASLDLRSVNENDCRRLWKWANDSAVRKSSFSSDPIPFEDHKRWFQKKLDDPGCSIYIAEQEKNSVGQIRFDRAESEATIDVSIVREQRGKGLGTRLIRKGVTKYLREHPGVTPVAFVKINNDASLEAFRNAGFECVDTTTIQNQEAYRLEFRKSSG